jgi:oligopeptide transport system ATP-binding protein
VTEATAVTPATDPTIKSPLLRVEHVVKHFPIGAAFGRAVVHAVDDVNLAIQPGETLGLVGESGCGKSTLGRLIVQLYPVTSGHVYFKDVDLTRLRGEKLRRMRQQIQMIFQDPYASLNPRMTVGDIVSEPLRNFGVAGGRNAEQRVQEVMRVVGLNPNFVNRYPHEFSGGQRQRIGIARALVLQPTFVVADEPVSALDVSIQAQIVNLMEDLQAQFKLTYLFIAHELAVVRHISNRVAVMYLGKIVEIGPSDAIRDKPLHPYTKVLQSSVPVPDPDVEAARKPILLKGEIPSPVHPPPACRFHTRCPIAQKICSEVEPPLEMKESGRFVACHFPGQL